MTQDEIVEMTRQAGGFDATPKFLETFAKLVAQHEREACAKVCEDKAERYAERAAKPENERDINRDTARIAQQTCFHLADNIRARSKE
jgi:hypothetical protein